MDEKIVRSIKKHALKNAFDYGSANAGKVVGKVLGEFPQEKANATEIMREITAQISQINKMEKDEIAKCMEEFEYGEGVKEESRQISLPNAQQGKVITRFPPEPSGHLHIGHAKAAFLNFESARLYGGHMRLRIDDTNPQKAKKEFADGVIDGLRWLGIEWDGKITHSSDYMKEFYAFAQELIMGGKAYVCTCTQDAIKIGREKKTRCDCSARMREENAVEFGRMVDGDYSAGQAILRYNGDMHSENTVMRDPTLFRVVEGKHWRVGEKYRCWPSYDFAAPIMDSVEGITHAMRSKEYELRDELYFGILEDLELRKPNLISFSRLAIKGAPISKRLITPLIEQGKVSGYDDIRLPTLLALRRRGITPEAIKTFVLGFGLSKVESEPGWDKLLSENRKMIDEGAPRKMFVPEGARVEVLGWNGDEIEIKNHPNNPKLGTRRIIASSPAYIPSSDANKIQIGEIFRLKDWCNVKVVEKGDIDAICAGGEKKRIPHLKCQFVSVEGMVEKKVQWVCDEAKVEACVEIAHDLFEGERFNEDSLEKVWGWGERSINSMDEGEICQFERFGFVKLDRKGENPTFVFISK